MSDHDPRPANVNVTSSPSTGGGLYFPIGALLVAALVGGYFLLGAPGLHNNVARAPDRNINVTVEQPRTAAPAQRQQ